jgi:hypothetical protein
VVFYFYTSPDGSGILFLASLDRKRYSGQQEKLLKPIIATSEKRRNHGVSRNKKCNFALQFIKV